MSVFSTDSSFFFIIQHAAGGAKTLFSLHTSVFSWFFFPTLLPYYYWNDRIFYTRHHNIVIVTAAAERAGTGAATDWRFLSHSSSRLVCVCVFCVLVHVFWNPFFFSTKFYCLHFFRVNGQWWRTSRGARAFRTGPAELITIKRNEALYTHIYTLRDRDKGHPNDIYAANK